MIIYRKETHDFDFMQVTLNIPKLLVNKKEYSAFDVDSITGVEANTAFKYSKDDYSYWRWDLLVFGFGVTIYRQYSY